MNEWNPKFDRCDRCNAEGNVQATKGEMYLYFCNHHFKEAASALDGWNVTTREFTLAN